MLLVVYFYNNYRLLKPNIDPSESKRTLVVRRNKVKKSNSKEQKNQMYIEKLNFIFAFFAES